jgi:peptide/nickel transport system substrate-binding protein
MKKRKLSLFGTVSILVILLFTVSSAAFAGGQNEGNSGSSADAGRFNVGFTTDEALSTLIPDESWQYVEMGCVFWPLVYDQLWIMGPAPDYKPIPMLAESWETEDNQTWTFHLRKNAVFHDGTPVTAEDVAFTLEYLPASDPAWEFEDTDCEDIQVIDDYTIQFTLGAKHGGEYPPVYWTPILPKHIWEAYKDDMHSFDNAQAIGSGPFSLKEFKSEQYIWLERNENYWGDKPGSETVVLKTYGSAEARNMALKKGEVEMIGYNGIDPLVLKDFENTDGIEVKIDPGITIDWLSFNLHKENAIADIEVRKAIMYGIDTDRIIDLAFLGYAEPADSFMYTELPDHNPNLPQFEYSVDKAKSILAAAGYNDTDGDGILNDPDSGENLVFELLGPSDWPREVKMITLIKEQMRDIGIEIEPKIVDLDTYYEFWYAPEEDSFDISIGNEEPGPHADWIWEFARSWDNGGEGWNCAYYNNAEFDEYLDDMAEQSDPEARKADLYKMQEILSEDLPYGFLVRYKSLNPVRSDKFTGYTSTMGGVSTWINPWSYFNVEPVE